MSTITLTTNPSLMNNINTVYIKNVNSLEHSRLLQMLLIEEQYHTQNEVMKKNLFWSIVFPEQLYLNQSLLQRICNILDHYEFLPTLSKPLVSLQDFHLNLLINNNDNDHFMFIMNELGMKNYSEKQFEFQPIFSIDFYENLLNVADYLDIPILQEFLKGLFAFFFIMKMTPQQAVTRYYNNTLTQNERKELSKLQSSIVFYKAN